MSKPHRIAKNASILMAMELTVRFLDGIIAVVLARYLAPDGFGLFAFAVSFASLFSMLPGFGMGALVTRDISRKPEDSSRYLTTGLIAKLCLALITLAIMWLASCLMGFPEEKWNLIFLAGLLMIFDTNARFALSFFQSAQRMMTLSLINVSIRWGNVLGSLAVIVFHGGIAELLAVRVLISGIGFVSGLVLINRCLYRIRWAVDPGFIIPMLKKSFPFALFRLFDQVYMDIDVVMLSAMRGDMMTGWYAAAQKFSRIFKFVPKSFSGAMLPALSRRTPNDIIVTVRRSIKYLMIVAMPAAAVITITADALVPLIFGKEYTNVTPALRVLIWSLPFAFVNSPITAAIASVNREREGSRNLIFGLLFTFLSNFFVIPLWGHVGAAATTLMAELMIFVLQIKLLKHELPDLRVLPEIVKPLAAALLMMSFVWFLRDGSYMVMIPEAALVYAAGLILLRVVDGRDLTMLRSIVGGKNE